MKKIVLENFDEGNDNYKINLFYLNREQVEEIKDIVSKWNHTEDEKMIRRIIEALQRYMPTDELWEEQEMVAWLEKQDKRKDYYTKQELYDMGFSFTLNGDIVTPDKMMEDMKKYFAWKEKQSEQKETPCDKYKKAQPSHSCQDITALGGCYKEDINTSNKVDPKFKAGDWIVQENIGVYKIIEICESWYEVIDVEDNHYSIAFDKEYMCHLWTIQEAKDGDILSAQECIVVFKEIDGLNIKCYCTYHYMNNPSFHVDTLQNKTAFHPAIKEQRDLLFEKMKEAGYEWDAEKKELKKIEDKLKWGEEDDAYTLFTISAVEDYYDEKNPLQKNLVDWLKSLKQRNKNDKRRT